MAKLYTEVEVQRLIAEATAPLLTRIAQLEAQLEAAKQGFVDLVEAPFQRPCETFAAGCEDRQGPQERRRLAKRRGIKPAILAAAARLRGRALQGRHRYQKNRPDATPRVSCHAMVPS